VECLVELGLVDRWSLSGLELVIQVLSWQGLQEVNSLLSSSKVPTAEQEMSLLLCFRI